MGDLKLNLDKLAELSDYQRFRDEIIQSVKLNQDALLMEEYIKNMYSVMPVDKHTKPEPPKSDNKLQYHYSVHEEQAVFTLQTGLQGTKIGKFWGVTKKQGSYKLDDIVVFARTKEDAEYIAQILNNASDALRQLAEIMSKENSNDTN